MTETPDWWPAGVHLSNVRMCNCWYCSDLLDSYADWRRGKAMDGQHYDVTDF